MSGDPIASRLSALLSRLAPKPKQPVSATVLNKWIAQAEGELGEEARSGRLGWLVASSVAIAAVQRALDTDGRELFLLKGGTLLQHRLNVTARTTKDVDGLVRGDLDAFFVALEHVLAEPWGPLTLRRGEVDVVRPRVLGGREAVAGSVVPGTAADVDDRGERRRGGGHHQQCGGGSDLELA